MIADSPSTAPPPAQVPRVTDLPERSELLHHLLRLVADRHVRRRCCKTAHGTTWHVTAECRAVPQSAIWTLETLTQLGLISWTPYLADPSTEFAWPTLLGLDTLPVWDAELFGGVL